MKNVVFLFVLSCTLLACNNGSSSKQQTVADIQENPLLTQEEVENFMRSNIPKTYSTFFDNGRGHKHSATWDNINITEIGIVSIVDEYNLKSYAKFSLQELYSYGTGRTETNSKDVWLRFNFTKSTDGKWYLKSVDPSNTRDSALYNLSEEIFKKYNRIALR